MVIRPFGVWAGYFIFWTFLANGEYGLDRTNVEARLGWRNNAFSINDKLGEENFKNKHLYKKNARKRDKYAREILSEEIYYDHKAFHHSL